MLHEGHLVPHRTKLFLLVIRLSSLCFQCWKFKFAFPWQIGHERGRICRQLVYHYMDAVT